MDSLLACTSPRIVGAQAKCAVCNVILYAAIPDPQKLGCDVETGVAGSPHGDEGDNMQAVCRTADAARE
jgi:hypothetical protein